jgi:hypothetical protein
MAAVCKKLADAQARMAELQDAHNEWCGLQNLCNQLRADSVEIVRHADLATYGAGWQEEVAAFMFRSAVLLRKEFEAKPVRVKPEPPIPFRGRVELKP